MLPLALEIALALLISGLLYLAFCTDSTDAALMSTVVIIVIRAALVAVLALMALKITYPDLYQLIISWLQSLAAIDLDTPAASPAPDPRRLRRRKRDHAPVGPRRRMDEA